MPQYETTLTLPKPIEEVFAFFCSPTNLVKISPPDMNIRLIEGPDSLQLGSRVTIEGRRWGIAQKITSEVTEFEQSVRIVDEQKQGPFRKWKQTQRFESLPDTGTKVSIRIEFEPPGGALGFVMTASAIEKDLRGAFAYRAEKLKVLLA